MLCCDPLESEFGRDDFLPNYSYLIEYHVYLALFSDSSKHVAVATNFEAKLANKVPGASNLLIRLRVAVFPASCSAAYKMVTSSAVSCAVKWRTCCRRVLLTVQQ